MCLELACTTRIKYHVVHCVMKINVLHHKFSHNFCISKTYILYEHPSQRKQFCWQVTTTLNQMFSALIFCGNQNFCIVVIFRGRRQRHNGRVAWLFNTAKEPHLLRETSWEIYRNLEIHAIPVRLQQNAQLLWTTQCKHRNKNLTQYIYTLPLSQKNKTLFFIVTLANVNRFSKFFHSHIRKKIL